jgi:hypothetical protein
VLTRVKIRVSANYIKFLLSNLKIWTRRGMSAAVLPDLADRFE